MAKERWKPINGWEKYYEISDHGNVRSLARVVTCLGKNGVTIEKHLPSRLRTPSTSRTGYKSVHLVINRKGPRLYVHRLVAGHFIDKKSTGGDLVLHSDDDPSNNFYKNLRWGTDQDNMTDKVVRNRQLHGEQVAIHVLTKKEVMAVFSRSTAGESPTALSKEYGVSESAVRQIRDGKTWKRLTGRPKNGSS